MAYWVYILRCGDGSLYTGSTSDLERRLAAHRAGKGAKYTRGRGPLELLYREAAPDWPAALRREAAIKRMDRRAKLALIEAAGRIDGMRPEAGAPRAGSRGPCCAENGAEK